MMKHTANKNTWILTNKIHSLLNKNMLHNKLKHLIISVVITLLATFGMWLLFFPVSVYMAENNFEKYMTEYSMDESDIEYYDVRKSFALSPVEIIVIYKSEPEYVYSYSYPICYFISNKPEYVSVKSDDVWYSAKEIYENLKHPAISLNYP